MIDELLPQAERIAARLKARGETISVAGSQSYCGNHPVFALLSMSL